VAGNHLVLGIGQGGMAATFNRERPRDLGGAYEERLTSSGDLAIGSPHNSVLEILVTCGVAGLIAVSALLAAVAVRYWRLLRSGPSIEIPFIGAGLGGFLVASLFNPLTIGPLAVFVVLLGMIVGLSSPTDARLPALPRYGRTLLPAGAAALAVPALIIAAAMVIADSRYSDVRAAGITTKSVAALHRLSGVLPFEAQYRRAEAEGYLALGLANHDRAALLAAEDRQKGVIADFEPLPTDYIRFAEALQALGEPGVDLALEMARNADPYGPSTAAHIESVRRGQ
jgi:hypothetical protein